MSYGVRDVNTRSSRYILKIIVGARWQEESLRIAKKWLSMFQSQQSNRFSTLNEVTDEIKQRKETRCPKVNVKKNNKLVFYSDGYGRGIPTSLSKINYDISVYGEVRPGAKVKEVLKNCQEIVQ
jgi:hypothetical protein